MRPFQNASPAPRALLYLATFSKAERAVIGATPELKRAIRESGPADWPRILEQYQSRQRAAIAQRVTMLADDAEGLRAQAVHDLREAASAYAGLHDGRRGELFNIAARLARYVAHRILSDAELRSALREAAAANGALAQHGAYWCDGCITRALRLGAKDPLPPLARRFRKTTGRVAI